MIDLSAPPHVFCVSLSLSGSFSVWVNECVHIWVRECVYECMSLIEIVSKIVCVCVCV